MNRIKVLILALFCFAAYANAQLGQCNSPYSRFGVGQLSDQAQGFNTSMAGTGIAIRRGNILNFTNPASYSAIDSTSFIIDAGMTFSLGNMQQGSASTNLRGATFDYLSFGFRLRKGLGMSIGFMPFSRIGYLFNKSRIISSDPGNMSIIKSHSVYSGEGGLRQVYLGMGWNPIAKLSVGVNAGFMWGTCDHSMLQTFSENDATSSLFNTLASVHQASIYSYSIDMGVQYPILLNNMNLLTLGATTSVGHSLKGDATINRYISADNTPADTATAPFDIPWRIGVGATWEYRHQWTVALDANYELWSKCETPTWNNTTGVYDAQMGAYKDRFSIKTGVEFVPDFLHRSYHKRIRYRAGFYYSSPYIKINDQNGPHEYGATLGLSLPITNNYGSRSAVNVGFKWLRRQATSPGLITENYYMITLGLTFNEMWFMKFKIK